LGLEPGRQLRESAEGITPFHVIVDSGSSGSGAKAGAETRISGASIVAGGSATESSTSEDTSQASKVDWTLRVTYGGTVADGVTLNIYSYDGANWDSEPLAVFSLDFVASTTKQKTFRTDGVGQAMRGEIVNRDTVNAIGAYTLKSTVLL